jgi:hypothetical protein
MPFVFLKGTRVLFFAFFFPLLKQARSGGKMRGNSGCCLSAASSAAAHIFLSTADPEGVVSLGAFLWLLSFGQSEKVTKAYFELVESKI